MHKEPLSHNQTSFPEYSEEAARHFFQYILPTNRPTKTELVTLCISWGPINLAIFGRALLINNESLTNQLDADFLIQLI